MLWWLAALALILGGASYYLWSVANERKAATRASAETIRTAAVFSGTLERTVRLSGTVGAERFAALLVPQLRGSRGGGRSGGGGGTSGGGGGGGSSRSGGTTVAPLGGSGGGGSSSGGSGGGSSSSSSSASLSSSSTDATSSGGTTNTAISGSSTGTSSLGAMRGTSNRFSDSSAVRGGSTGSSSSSSSRSSSSTGAASLGSTASSLISMSRMGGGGNDFMMVLLNLAKPGSFVKKGDVVAEFDRQFQLNRLDDYRANLVQHEARIKKVEADQAVYLEAHRQMIRSAKADLDKALLDVKTAEVRSEIEAEQLKLAVEETQARYKQILSEVPLVDQRLKSQLKAAVLDRNQTAIELKRAEVNIDKMLVKAPLDGIVVMQTIHRGGEMAQIQAGDMLYPGQYFMQIVDPRSMVLNASVNQVDGEALRVNMKARIGFDAYPGIELKGHILGIGAMTRPGMWRPSYMREIPVKLALDEMDPRIIPDLSAGADIVLAAETNQASLAPLGSVFQDADSRPFVFLRRPSGFERREVELGLRNNIAVAVRSGLKPGDVVALDRPQPVEPK